jgi:hypothetical protein
VFRVCLTFELDHCCDAICVRLECLENLLWNYSRIWFLQTFQDLVLENLLVADFLSPPCDTDHKQRQIRNVCGIFEGLSFEFRVFLNCSLM